MFLSRLQDASYVRGVFLCPSVLVLRISRRWVGRASSHCQRDGTAASHEDGKDLYVLCSLVIAYSYRYTLDGETHKGEAIEGKAKGRPFLEGPSFCLLHMPFEDEFGAIGRRVWHHKYQGKGKWLALCWRLCYASRRSPFFVREPKKHGKTA